METIDSAFPEFQSSVLPRKKQGDRLLAPLCGVLAFIFYCLMIPHALPPGAPAELTATAMGLPAQSPPFHLLWRTLASIAAHLPLGTMAFKLALLSALCSALAASLIYQVAVELMMYRLIPHGTGIDHLKVRAVQIGGAIGALAFVLATPATLAATRASLRAMDGILLLLPVWFFLRYFDGRSVINLLLAGAVCGLGMGETPGCIGIFFAILLCGIILIWRQNRSTLPMLAFAGLALVMLLLVYPGCCYLRDLPGGDLTQLLSNQWSELSQDYHSTRTGMLICALSLFPMLLALTTLRQTLNYSEDYESLLILSTLATASLLVLTNAFAPFRNFAMLSPEPPVIPYLFAALTCGFVAASWWTIALSHTPSGCEPDEPDLYHQGTPHIVRGVGYGLAIGITVGVVCVGGLTSRALHARPDWYPQFCASTILHDLGNRRWLFGHTPVNTHLAVLASEQQIPLQIIPLTANEDWTSRIQPQLTRSLATDDAFAGLDHTGLTESLALGPDAFLRAWLLSDVHAADKLVIAGSPLEWETCGFQPVPTLFFFGGSLHDAPPSSAFADQLLRAEQMRQHAEAGRFLDGTTGYILAEAEQNLAAAAAFTATTFNRAGASNTASILTTGWDTPRAPLNSSDKRYASALAWLWETTVLPGRPERMDILHTIRDDALLAALETKEDVGALRRAAAASARTTRANSEVPELYARARTSADQAMVNQTFSCLAQLDQRGAPTAQLRILRAEANLAMAGGEAQAFPLLQDATSANPRDLWAWHLLIAASLQRGDIEQAENLLLPAMEQASEHATNDLTRLTHALVLCARGGSKLRAARTLFAEVANANPALLVAREWALRLDVILHDDPATLRDAYLLAAVDENHAQANYILACSAIRTRQFSEADRRYRQSLTGAMTPQALVGRARLYCQLRNYVEALQLARKATTDYPAYLDGWLVLGDALEATGKPGEAAVVRSRAVRQ